MRDPGQAEQDSEPEPGEPEGSQPGAGEVTGPRTPSSFLNEVDGDYLGYSFKHQARESGGTIWITSPDGQRIEIGLDYRDPDVLLAAIYAAIRARLARPVPGQQSDTATIAADAAAADSTAARGGTL